MGQERSEQSQIELHRVAGFFKANTALVLAQAASECQFDGRTGIPGTLLYFGGELTRPRVVPKGQYFLEISTGDTTQALLDKVNEIDPEVGKRLHSFLRKTKAL